MTPKSAAASVALILLGTSASVRADLQLPQDWIHTYANPLLGSDVTITYGAPVDSCVLRDESDNCLRLVEDLVSVTWSGGPDDMLVNYFSAAGSTPDSITVYLEGWDREDIGGFYSTPVMWVPPGVDRQVGFSWTWNGDLVGDPGGVITGLSLEGTVESAGDVLVVPFRPQGASCTRIFYDSPIVAMSVDGTVDLLGKVVPTYRVYNTRWWGEVNQSTCVMFADDVLDLVDIVDPQGQSVVVERSSMGQIKARY